MDGVPIGEDAVAMWTERLQPHILERKATFFEASTAIAFADFAARGAEIVVVGGRTGRAARQHQRACVRW